ncbi:ANTAR domain-containing protein [Amycolatopsis iheyensis]|uniref:ANTAR domain-containing protein n=1 Tax=Amycolatopsis iheyensis TaxID=2945988 RepID=UPI0035575F04
MRVLRGKLAYRPKIARALGVVQERYRLPDEEAAFRLLRSASQVHNVKVHRLAEVLVDLPHPGRADPVPPRRRTAPRREPGRVRPARRRRPAAAGRAPGARRGPVLPGPRRDDRRARAELVPRGAER